MPRNGGGTAGVAFNVKLMPVKVISTRVGRYLRLAQRREPTTWWRWASDTRRTTARKVINMSIGRTGPANCGTNPDQDGCAPVIEDAVSYAVSKGAFVAIAAGNSFDEGNPTEVLAEIASRIPGAVSVAAVNKARGHRVLFDLRHLHRAGGAGRRIRQASGARAASCSRRSTSTWSRPSTVRRRSYGPPRFDALAYFYFAGTSQADAACVRPRGDADAAGHYRPGRRSRRRWSDLPTDLGSPGRDSFFGFGLVDARNTLRGLGLAR